MKALAVILIAALGFVSWRLADVERQRYAAIVGLCPGTITAVDPVCLNDAHPRESDWWNLWYGLQP